MAERVGDFCQLLKDAVGVGGGDGVGGSGQLGLREKAAGGVIGPAGEPAERVSLRDEIVGRRIRGSVAGAAGWRRGAASDGCIVLLDGRAEGALVRGYLTYCSSLGTRSRHSQLQLI